MKKSLLFLGWLLLAPLFLQAQVIATADPVIVWEVRGDATYTKEGQDISQPLSGAAEVEQTTTVTIGSGGYATLLYKGKKYTLDNEGEFNIAEMIEKDPPSEEDAGGFWGEMGRMAFASSKGGGGGDTSGGGRTSGGWGKKDQLIPVFPLQGMIVPQEATFNWVSGKSNKPYYCQLVEKGEEIPLLAAEVADTSFVVDLAALNLEEGKTYVWQISQKANMKKAKSQEITIQSAEVLRGTLEKLNKTEAFRNADELEQMIRIAQAFEEGGYNNQANKIYQKALEASNGNTVISRLYGVFLEKQGLGALAAKYFQ